MIVCAQQPYFAPFPGYFVRALLSDVLVLMDDVQFPRGTTWLSRNRFKNDQGVLWLTVPVWKKGLGLQRIRDVRICREGQWARKHRLSLRTAYRDAPFFRDHEALVEEIFSAGFEGLADLNVRIIRYALAAFGIPAELRLLSELGIGGREPALSVAICRRLGASLFLAPQGARRYLPPEAFAQAGVKLVFFQFRPPVYPQLWGSFQRNLSALDLLFNCGPRAGDLLRQRCPTLPAAARAHAQSKMKGVIHGESHVFGRSRIGHRLQLSDRESGRQEGPRRLWALSGRPTDGNP